MDEKIINQCPEFGSFKGYVKYFMCTDSDEDQKNEEGPVTDSKEDYNWELAEDLLIDDEVDDDAMLDIDFQVDSDKVLVSSDVTSLQNDHELQELPGLEGDCDGDGPVMICPVPMVTVNVKEGIQNENSYAMFLAAVDQAVSNPFFNMVFPGLDARDIGIGIKSAVEVDAMIIKHYADKLYTEISGFVGEKATNKKDISKLLKMFHRLQTSSVMYKAFSELLVKSNIIGVDEKVEGMALLHSFIMEQMLHSLIKTRNIDKVNPTSALNIEDLRISDREQTIIRKVAGYIPFSLRKHYRKVLSDDAKLIIKIIESWDKRLASNDHASLIEFTNEWVDKTDRGGLFLVTDNFYRFVVRIEITARKVLNSSLLVEYAGQDIRKIVMEKLEADQCLSVGWETLVRHVNNEHVRQVLRKAIFSKWVTIRANAFVKAWIDQLKLKQQNDKQATAKKVDSVAQPSLRKSLT